MPDPMRTVSFKLPEHLDELLRELAKQRKASRSGVVREAIAAYVARGTPSVTMRVDELVSTVAGPPDLSTNPKHLRGYGR